MLLVLVVVLVALTPLAYASPPDPSWNRGVYDDSDFDDGVVLITSATGVVDPFPLDGACAGQPAVGTLRDAVHSRQGVAAIVLFRPPLNFRTPIAPERLASWFALERWFRPTRRRRQCLDKLSTS